MERMRLKADEDELHVGDLERMLRVVRSEKMKLEKETAVVNEQVLCA